MVVDVMSAIAKCPSGRLGQAVPSNAAAEHSTEQDTKSFWSLVEVIVIINSAWTGTVRKPASMELHLHFGNVIVRLAIRDHVASFVSISTNIHTHIYIFKFVPM